MQIVTTRCPSCNASYGGRVTSRFITCEYCGSRFALSAEELEALGFRDRDGDGYDDDDSYSTYKESYVDTGSAPMAQFAADSCERFLDLNDVDQSDFVCSDKIVRGLNLSSGDDIYLIHDDTLFKSGKNGFAITSDGLYCRELGEREVQFTDWSGLARGKRPNRDDSYIRQNEKALCYFTGNDSVRDNLLDLCIRLWNHAQKMA